MPPKNSKARRWPVQEGLAALTGVYAAEDRIAVHQRHHEKGDLDLHAVEHDVGIAEIDLGLAGPVAQGHERLGVLAAPGPHGVLDDGVAAVVVVLGLQAVEDAFGGVALLAGGVLILLQNLVDDRQERLELGLAAGVRPADSPAARDVPGSS